MELMAGAHAVGTASDHVYTWPVGGGLVTGAHPPMALFPSLPGALGTLCEDQSGKRVPQPGGQGPPPGDACVSGIPLSQGVTVHVRVTCVRDPPLSQGIRVHLQVTCACQGPLVGCDNMGASPGCACPPNSQAQRVVGWCPPKDRFPSSPQNPRTGTFLENGLCRCD